MSDNFDLDLFRQEVQQAAEIQMELGEICYRNAQLIELEFPDANIVDAPTMVESITPPYPVVAEVAA